MKQRTLPVYVLALALLLYGCKPESPCDENQRAEHLTYNLEPGTKEQVPYRADGLDTLVYISDAGDTAVLYGQGIKTDYTGESRNRNANPDCPLWDTWSRETWQYTYTGSNVTFNSVDFAVTADGLSINGTPRTIVDYAVNVANKYHTNLQAINNEAYYSDTVVINAIEYRGVPLVGNNNNVIIYNHRYGLLKVSLNNSIWRKHF